MRRQSRSFVVIAVVLIVGAAVAFYWTSDSSPLDLLRELHAPRH